MTEDPLLRGEWGTSIDSPPMRVSVVGPTYPFRGGISHYTSLLVRTLRPSHEVQFLSYSHQYPGWLYPGNGDHDPSSSLILTEDPHTRFDARNPWAWKSIAREIVQHQSRLVILPWSVAYWGPFFFVFLQALRRCSPAAVLFICHNVLEHETSGLKTSISKRVLRMGDYFITHSQWDKENLVRWVEPSRENCIWVSPHPAYQHLQDMSLSKTEARRRLGVAADKVILFFGFVREYKGLRYLLESLPLVLKYYPIHLLIAGEIWQGAKVYSGLIRNLRLQDHLTLVNRYIPNEKVGLYFSAADLVVVPYISATQSGIVQMSFGFKRPVVVGNVGGLPEVVDDRRTGYLVRPRDPGAIAQAVLDFYNGRREDEMVRNIECALSRFSWETMLTTIDRIAVQL